MEVLFMSEILGAVFGLGFFGIFLLIGLLSTIGVIWALYSILATDTVDDDKQLLWVLVVIFAGFIGVLLYYFIEHRN